jgi:hypothetical protein
VRAYVMGGSRAEIAGLMGRGSASATLWPALQPQDVSAQTTDLAVRLMMIVVVGRSVVRGRAGRRPGELNGGLGRAISPGPLSAPAESRSEANPHRRQNASQPHTLAGDDEGEAEVDLLSDSPPFHLTFPRSESPRRRPEIRESGHRSALAEYCGPRASSSPSMTPACL